MYPFARLQLAVQLSVHDEHHVSCLLLGSGLRAVVAHNRMVLTDEFLPSRWRSIMYLGAMAIYTARGQTRFARSSTLRSRVYCILESHAWGPARLSNTASKVGGTMAPVYIAAFARGILYWYVCSYIYLSLSRCTYPYLVWCLHLVCYKVLYTP